MAVILITPKKEIITTDDALKMHVYQAFFCRGKEIRTLQDYSGSPEGELEFKVKTFLGCINLKIPAAIHKAIRVVLQQYHTKQNTSFDCYSFACLLSNVQSDTKGKLTHYWHLKWCRILPRVGDVIFFIDADQSMFRHAAVYLGYGYYIQVYGAGGDLEITRLTDMKKDYRGCRLYRAAPRS